MLRSEHQHPNAQHFAAAVLPGRSSGAAMIRPIAERKSDGTTIFLVPAVNANSGELATLLRLCVAVLFSSFSHAPISLSRFLSQ
jgi:hypothetical protein